jgi:hypothetical protein
VRFAETILYRACTCVANEKVFDQGNVQPAAWNMGRVLREATIDLVYDSSSASGDATLPQVCGPLIQPNM